MLSMFLGKLANHLTRPVNVFLIPLPILLKKLSMPSQAFLILPGTFLINLTAFLTSTITACTSASKALKLAFAKLMMMFNTPFMIFTSRERAGLMILLSQTLKYLAVRLRIKLPNFPTRFKILTTTLSK